MLILGCYSIAFAQERPQPANAAPGMTPERAGQEMFHTHCVACHGTDAKGNGPAAPGLKKHPPDLTQLSRRNGGKFPAEIVSSVIQGNDFITDHGTRDMPLWGDAFRATNRDETLTKLKVRNLTAYIESIQQKQ
jgi:mono/diheme cytochrome c family protein